MLLLLGMLGMWDRRRASEIWLVSQLKDDEVSRNIWDIPEHTERTFQAISLEIAQTLALAMPDAQLRRRQQPGARGDQRLGALDRLSLDLLVADEADCYSALYMIHRQWRPAEGAIHDYIGASKDQRLSLLAHVGHRPSWRRHGARQFPHSDKADG